MAVAVELFFPGGTLAQYDQVMGLMGLDREGATLPAGAISHWAAATEGGLRVVDVWESAPQFEAFAREQIGPFSQQAGFTAPPEVTMLDVHNVMVQG